MQFLVPRALHTEYVHRRNRRSQAKRHGGAFVPMELESGFQKISCIELRCLGHDGFFPFASWV